MCGRERRARRRAPLVLPPALVALAALAAGCAHNPAPRGFLDGPVASQQSAWGGWIEVWLQPGAHLVHVARGEVAPAPYDRPRGETGGIERASWPLEVRGELAAVGDDSLYVIAADGLAAVARADIDRARLTGYEAGTGAVRTWAAVGAVSTLSHGVVLVLSAPVWGLAGSGAAAVHEGEARREWPPRGHDADDAAAWAALRAYARFPQGLPAGVRRAELSARPLPDSGR